MPSLTLVVPSYRRPKMLAACLGGVARQTLRPDEVIVVVRQGDLETHSQLEDLYLPDLRIVQVTRPGMLAALRAGVAAVDTEVVAMTDDDAVPRPDWLARLLPYFSDPSVGAVGGRDAVYQDDEPIEPATMQVGTVSTWGKVTGNHHLGLGQARDVMVLKGVNIAFRKESLAFPERLRGSGTQLHQDLATSLWAGQRGWRLVYDPKAVVDHYHGDRFGVDKREGTYSPQAARDAAYNLTAALVSLGPCPAWRRMAFGVLVGDRRAPGIARALAAAVRPADRVVVRHLVPSLSGQLEAYRDCRWGQGLTMSAPTPEVDG